MTTIPNYRPVTIDGLQIRGNGQAYEITPAKGARVAGTIVVGVSVGVSSEEIRNSNGNHWEKISVPSMWVDFTPRYVDSYTDNVADREPITVNGKSYGGGQFESVSGSVDFLPVTAGNAHLSDYYPRATVDGQDYYLRGGVSQYDTVSDAARKVLGDLVAAIAAEYVTDARWLDHQISVAEYALDRAATATADAVTAETEARDTLNDLLSRRR